MKFPVAIALACAAVLAFSASAEAETASPYAGWQARDIKALSPEQIADLRDGRGMGLALPAELNGYPGPRHVLDLGADLALSPEQREAFEGLFAEMQAEARRLGDAILRQEAALEQAFRGGAVSEPVLRQDLAALGALQGELRYTHLRYHLAAKALLSPHQVARYNTLRGYGTADGHGGDGHASEGHEGHGKAH